MGMVHDLLGTDATLFVLSFRGNLILSKKAVLPIRRSLAMTCPCEMIASAVGSSQSNRLHLRLKVRKIHRHKHSVFLCINENADYPMNRALTALQKNMSLPPARGDSIGNFTYIYSL
jgi:hypothetical protein